MLECGSDRDDDAFAARFLGDVSDAARVLKAVGEDGCGMVLEIAEIPDFEHAVVAASDDGADVDEGDAADARTGTVWLQREGRERLSGDMC